MGVAGDKTALAAALPGTVPMAAPVDGFVLSCGLQSLSLYSAICFPMDFVWTFTLAGLDGVFSARAKISCC